MEPRKNTEAKPEDSAAQIPSVAPCYTFITDLKKAATMKQGEIKREGVVVYYHAFRKYTKHTVKDQNGKWCK